MEEMNAEKYDSKTVEWSGEFQEVTQREGAFAWPFLALAVLLFGAIIVRLAVWLRRRRRTP
jgi:hypothetical protein